MQIGNVTLHVVSDGTYRKDGGSLFGLVPKTLWEQVALPDEWNRLQFALHCLLIETEGQRILIDTGYGDKLAREERASINLQGERRLLGELERLGIGPSDVDWVVNTHLHVSHCGGNTHFDDNKEIVPTFPSAAYAVQRLELADASFPNERTRTTYLPENFAPLEQNGQLRILSGNARLSDAVRVVITPGHTRAHQSIVVESEGQTAVFLGDVAPWPIHIERLSWVPADDVEPLVTIQTKRDLAHWAIEHNVLLIFGHHPEIKAGYLHTSDRTDRFRLEPFDI